MPHSPERLHGLDFLRALMMFLGILLHGVVSFMETVVPFWAVRDVDRSPFADLFMLIVHTFRMQTFFFLAGFFGCLIYQRYGLGGMLRHRFLRIAVPFALGVLIIGPTLQAVWLMGDLTALRFVGMGFETSQSTLQRLETHFLTGNFLLYLFPWHLWFLYFLVIFFLAMVPLIGLGRLIQRTAIARSFDTLVQHVFASPFGFVVLSLISLPLMWPMKVWGMADTSEGWRPDAHLLGYYFVYFLIGWQLWRHRDLLRAFTKRWKLILALGNLLVLPTMLALLSQVLEGLKDRTKLPGEGYHLAVCVAATLYTWSMVVGLTGLFVHRFDGERPWVRYLADASYWCYLWHLTLIVLLQIALAQSPLPGLLKYTIIIGVTMTILLVTYEWFVRYTMIGVMLNGRRFSRGKAGD